MVHWNCEASTQKGGNYCDDGKNDGQIVNIRLEYFIQWIWRWRWLHTKYFRLSDYNSYNIS